MGTTVIGLVVIAIVVLYLIYIYNQLVSLRNQFKNGFAQIDVQLQRRHDLIPNLVEAAKAYLSHEKSTLTQVMEARNNAVSAQKDAARDPGDSTRIQRLGSADTECDRIVQLPPTATLRTGISSSASTCFRITARRSSTISLVTVRRFRFEMGSRTSERTLPLRPAIKVAMTA